MAGDLYDACKIMKHPKYATNETDYFYDIGLILLSKNIKRSKKIDIARIADFNTWRNGKYSMTIAGFGKSGVSNENIIRGFTNSTRSGVLVKTRSLPAFLVMFCV